MFLVALLWLFVATPSMEGESIVSRSRPAPATLYHNTSCPTVGTRDLFN